MKTEYEIFGVVAAFLFVARASTRWWTTVRRPAGIEWIGVVALALSGLLCAMCGGYFWFVSPPHRPAPRGPRRGARSPTAPARSASSARAATGRSAWRWPPSRRPRPGLPALVADRRRPGRASCSPPAACSSSTTAVPGAPPSTEPSATTKGPASHRDAGPFACACGWVRPVVVRRPGPQAAWERDAARRSRTGRRMVVASR